MKNNQIKIWMIVAVATLIVSGMFLWSRRHVAAPELPSHLPEATMAGRPEIKDHHDDRREPPAPPSDDNPLFMGYTPADIEQATGTIMAEFQTFGEGFEMHSLDPLPERNTTEELNYINSLGRGHYDHVLVIASSFHTPSEFNEMTAWEADKEYTWEWYLGRTDETAWEIVTYGY